MNPDSSYTESSLVNPLGKPQTIRVLAFLEAHSITGPAKVIVELAREAMRGTGSAPRLEIVIATFLRGVSENGFTRALQAEGIPLEIIRERGVFDPRVAPQMRAILARRKPDILWTHAVKSHFLARLTAMHRKTHWIASHHGYTATDWKTRAYNELDRWSHRGAERVVTVCRKFAGDLTRRGIRPERIRVQHNPVRASQPPSHEAVADLRRSLGLTEGSRVVLSVGRLSLEKGHADLIRAFARVRSIAATPLRLVFVGDGPELARLEALARALNVRDATTFAGHQSDVRPYYAVADLFVLPSHSEGSPNVLLEAMDAGVPVVATAAGGIPEIVTAGESALLVEARDSQALAAAMARLLSDEDLRIRLTIAAREQLKMHTPEIYFQELRAFFEEVARA